jgi:hypothetical protein
MTSFDYHRSSSFYQISITVSFTEMPFSGPSISPESRGVACPLHHSGRTAWGFCHGLDAINGISFPMLSGPSLILEYECKDCRLSNIHTSRYGSEIRMQEIYEV